MGYAVSFQTTTAKNWKVESRRIEMREKTWKKFHLKRTATLFSIHPTVVLSGHLFPFAFSHSSLILSFCPSARSLAQFLFLPSFSRICVNARVPNEFSYCYFLYFNGKSRLEWWVCTICMQSACRCIRNVKVNRWIKTRSIRKMAAQRRRWTRRGWSEAHADANEFRKHFRSFSMKS